MHAHFPRPDGLLLGDKDAEKEDEVGALKMPGKEIPGEGEGRVRVPVRARVERVEPPR